MDTRWTPELEAEAIRILGIIEKDVAERKLPPAVYEALVRTHKKISAEIALFNERGEIWLIQRPSKEIHPTDPYAGEWHLPGVVHNVHETTEVAFERVFSQEIGNVKAVWQGDVTPIEVNDGRRGMYIALLRTYRLEEGAPLNEGNAGFFNTSSLPSPMVPFHKTLLIPEAVRMLNLKK